MLLSCLAVSNCDCDKDNKKFETFRIKIVPPAEVLRFTALSTQLELNIESGCDRTANYKVKVENIKSFDTTDWRGAETTDEGAKTILVIPDDGKTLEELLGKKQLTKDDKPKLYCRFAYHNVKNKGQSASADISIVGKDNKVVSGPVTIRWTLVQK